MAKIACYNPPLPQKHRFSMRSFRPRLVLLLICVLFVTQANPDSIPEGNRALARQIIAKVGAGSVITLITANVSSAGEKQFEQVQRDLQAQLRAQGLRLASASESVAEVRATLSENLEGYLWVAQIRQGPKNELVMVPLGRAEATAATPPIATVTLHRTLLWSQEEPILDLAVLQSADGKSHLLVLAPAQIALYRAEGGAPEASVAIPQYGPWPRDLRGRLMLRRDHLFDAYLPGEACSSVGQSVGSAQCRATDDPWPLTAENTGSSAFFSSSRNFFTGILSGPARGRTLAPFFSAARIEDKGRELWLLDGVDGRVRFFDGFAETSAGIKGWGSDIAALRSACGSGWQVLAGSGGDPGPDMVQAFELAGRDLVVASQPLEFKGPVTALWPATDNASALAVARNLSTGRYEAFALTISCSR